MRIRKDSLLNSSITSRLLGILHPIPQQSNENAKMGVTGRHACRLGCLDSREGHRWAVPCLRVKVYNLGQRWCTSNPGGHELDHRAFRTPTAFLLGRCRCQNYLQAMCEGRDNSVGSFCVSTSSYIYGGRRQSMRISVISWSLSVHCPGVTDRHRDQKSVYSTADFCTK